jgi:hypothetical protein
MTFHRGLWFTQIHNNFPLSVPSTMTTAITIYFKCEFHQPERWSPIMQLYLGLFSRSGFYWSPTSYNHNLNPFCRRNNFICFSSSTGFVWRQHSAFYAIILGLRIEHALRFNSFRFASSYELPERSGGTSCTGVA